MKLHLPKRLFTALLTAITLAAAPAALTLGSAAWGEEEASTPAESFAVDYSVFNGYAYDIYQWTGADGRISRGYWYQMVYDVEKGGLDYVYAEDGTKQPSGSYDDTSGYEGYIASNKTLVFNADSTKNTSEQSGYAVGTVYAYDCGPMTLSGVVVKNEIGVADTLVGNNNGGNRRELRIGGLETNSETGVTETSYSIIEKDFAIDTNNSDVTLQGVQVWQVASDATYTFKTSNSTTRIITLNGNLTLQGGTVDFQSTLKMTGSSVLTVEQGAKLTATEIKSDGAADTKRSIFVNEGASVTTGTLWIAYNMGSVDVDGSLNVSTELYLGSYNRNNTEGLLTGTGVITASKLRAGNWGSYGINVATLDIGTSGLVVEQDAVLNLASTTTTVSGTTTVYSGNVLNFNSGSATLTGEVSNGGNININGGVVAMNGGMSGAGSLSIAEGAELIIAAGATMELSHTITGAGRLTLNGNLHITDYTQLNGYAASYSNGANGFLNTWTAQLMEGTLIQGNGASFTATGMGAGSTLKFDAETGYLTATLASDGVYYVNDTLEYSDASMGTATSLNISSTGTLGVDLSAEETVELPLPISNSGVLNIEADANDVALNSLFGGGGISQASAASTTITTTGAVTVDDADLNTHGTLEINNAATFENNQNRLVVDKLVLNNVAEATINGTNSGTGKVSGTIEVLGKSKLILTGLQDQLGWSGASNDFTDKILLRGADADNLATLQLDTRQTCSTAIVLEGYSSITNGGAVMTNSNAANNNVGMLQMHDGGSITAKGTNNEISAVLNANKATTIAVTYQSDTLDITGAVIGGNAITKSGAGTLTFAGDMSHLNGAVNVTGGTVKLAESATLSNSSSFSVTNNATLSIQGDKTIGTLSAASAGVTLGDHATLTLGGGTADAQKQHSIGTLSAASAGVTLGDYATLTLGGGTEENPVTHSIGTLTASDSSKLSLAAYSTLTLGSSHTVTYLVSGAGELVVEDGVILTLANGDDPGDKRFDTNVRIKDGGRMVFTGLNYHDQLNYNNGRTVYLEGTAELALGNTRQTVGNWIFDMTGGTISGQGQSDNAYALDFHSTGYIKAHAATGATLENPTVSTVSASIKNRDGNGSQLNLVVYEKARLNLTGDLWLEKPVEKSGAGLAVISGTVNKLSEVHVTGGTLELQSSASTGSAISVSSGAKFEISAGTSALSGAVTNNGTFEVSGGSATLSGAVTNNSAITVSGGTADFTNTLGMGTDSSLSVSDGSATVSGTLNVTGTGVQIGQSGNGELNLTGSVSVAEGAAATLSGAITLGHTITNDGSLTLDGTIYLTGDIDSSYEHREQGGTSYALAGSADSNDLQNGFMTVKGASYYLAQSSDGVTNATNTADNKVVYHGTTSYKVDTDNKGLYFSTGDITGTQYYITTGDVVVNKDVQAAATGYTLQGGTMKLTAGSVNTSTITYTAGSITLSDGAELVLDGVPAGMTVNSLLSGILSSTSAGNVKIARSGLDTYDGEGSGPADYSLNSAFAGTLELSAGVDFTLGNGNKDTYSQDAVITLGNLSGMKLNDGSTLYYNASGVTTIKNLQVVDAASATIHFKDSYSANAVQFAGKTQLDGDLTVSTKYDGGITFTNLVGDGSLTGSSGSGTFNTTISSLQYTEGDVTSRFTGSLSFSGSDNVVEVSTGTGAGISFVSLSATNVNSLTFKVQTGTSIETLDVATGAVIVSDGKTLTLGGGTAEAQAQHSIGTLSAAAAGVTLGDHATLTLGAGTADAQKQHSIGTLSAASAGVTLGDYATLTLGGGTVENPVTHSIGTLTGGAGSKLNLAENAVLNQLTSVPGPVTVTGSGTYIMGNTGYTNLTGWTDDTWTGTVVLDGMVLAGNADNKKLHEFGNAGSTVKLTDVTGWFWNTLDSNGQTFADAQSYGFALELVNGTNGYALKVTNGSSNSTTEFTGDISGTGDLHLDATSTVTGQVFTFSGDISNWKAITSGTESPEIKVINRKVYNIKLTGSADEVNVAFNRGDGTLHLTVETAATFNNTIDVNTLTLTQSATFNANTTASIMDAASSTVTLGENVTLALGAGTSSTQMQHSIGTLSAASAGVTLGEYATLTLGGGTTTTHTIGTLSSSSTSKVSISSGSNLILTSVDSVNGDITGDGALTLQTGSTPAVGLGHSIFGSAINTINLTGAGSGLEITSSSTQPANFAKIQNINVEDGATFYNRVTSKNGWVLNPENNINISLAGAGNGAATGAALSLGYDCQNGGTVAFGDKVNFSLSDDATVIVHGRNRGNDDIAGVINTTIQGNSHTLTKIGTGKLTLENGASNTSLNVNEGELVLKGAATTSERVKLNGGTLKLADQATVTTRQDSADAATMSKVQMSSTGITGTAQDSSISDADIEVLAQDASFTIQDMTLTNTSITAASVNTQVNLTNVSAESVQLSDGKFVVTNQATMSEAQVAAGGSEGSKGTFTASTTLLSGITLNSGSITVDLGDLSSYDDMGPGKYDLSITLGGFRMDEYSGDYAGSALQFAAGSWLSELLAQGNNASVKISITQAAEGAAAAAAGVSGGSTGVSYSTDNVGMVITINGLNVPEPTTATLSLLALAALAGRRRRK